MKRNFYFILDGKTATPEPDYVKWAKWFEVGDRIVKKTDIGDVHVSTVFLGLDHQVGEGPPILFETMTFGPGEEVCERCSTWEEAEAQHERVCAMVEPFQTRKQQANAKPRDKKDD